MGLLDKEKVHGSALFASALCMSYFLNLCHLLGVMLSYMLLNSSSASEKLIRLH
ncbi:hypothetical protein Scep_027528 [Stephania cephalantha]|uniref:Uncharacterized protein n=1 Tax=Stephania cephalantha TaxID=152367 RepID=A0AAP0E870_9MAGN